MVVFHSPSSYLSQHPSKQERDWVYKGWSNLYFGKSLLFGATNGYDIVVLASFSPLIY